MRWLCFSSLCSSAWPAEAAESATIPPALEGRQEVSCPVRRPRRAAAGSGSRAAPTATTPTAGSDLQKGRQGAHFHREGVRRFHPPARHQVRAGKQRRGHPRSQRDSSGGAEIGFSTTPPSTPRSATSITVHDLRRGASPGHPSRPESGTGKRSSARVGIKVILNGTVIVDVTRRLCRQSRRWTARTTPDCATPGPHRLRPGNGGVSATSASRS